MGGRGGGGSRGASFSSESPMVGGSYKATSEMNDIAMQVAKDMQKEFSLLSKQFRIEFNKYMDAAGLGFQDHIELNGAYIKKLLRSGRYSEVKGIIAHELTHTMQARLNTKLGVKGSDAREKSNEKMWNNAVNKFIKKNPKYTLADVNKAVSHSYGGGGHSRYGGNATERMAVAVEHHYSGQKSIAGQVGKYVMAELKRKRKK